MRKKTNRCHDCSHFAEVILVLLLTDRSVCDVTKADGYSLFEVILGFLGVLAEQRKEVPRHIEVELRRAALVEVVRQNHLR